MNLEHIDRLEMPDSLKGDPKRTRSQTRLKWILILIVLTAIGLTSFMITRNSVIDSEISYVIAFITVFAAALLVAATLVAALVFASFLITVIHELGHVIAGKVVDFKFHTVQLGPFWIYRTSKGVRLSFQSGFGLVQGFAICYPQGFDNLVPRSLLYMAGGLLANLLVGLATLALYLNLSASVEYGSALYWLRYPLLWFVGFSLLTVILSLIPAKYRGIESDGSHILNLLRREPEAVQSVELLAISGKSMGGQRPRDWDFSVIEKTLENPEQNTNALGANLLAYLHKLDQSSFRDARDHLQKVLDILDPKNKIHGPIAIAEAAYFEAAIRKDIEAAFEWIELLSEASTHLSNSVSLRAHAAFLHLAGIDRQALGKIEEARNILQESIEDGEGEMELDLLQKLEMEIRVSDSND